MHTPLDEPANVGHVAGLNHVQHALHAYTVETDQDEPFRWTFAGHCESSPNRVDCTAPSPGRLRP
jgi:hypothetical protein